MNDHELLRGAIIDLLRLDLFGPYKGEEEVIDEAPVTRYLTGVLFPRDTMFEKEKDDGGMGQESQTSEDDTEEGLIMSNFNYPSCFGTSFGCTKDSHELRIIVKAGVYEKKIEGGALERDSKKGEGEEAKDEIAGDRNGDRAPVEGTAKRDKYLWKRKHIEWSEVISVKNPDNIEKLVVPGLSVRLRIRPPDKTGVLALTLSVVNDNKGARSQVDICEKSFFQVYFAAMGLQDEKPFVERCFYGETATDPDTQSIRLLYRSIKLYAVGHGCSVDWKNEEGGRVGQIESSFVPQQTVYPFISRLESGPNDFSVKKIAEGSNEQLRHLFAGICSNFDLWIEKKEEEIDSLPTEFKEAANRHIKLCKEASLRIKAGIELLNKDQTVFDAFKLAHRVMLYHLAHSAWLNAGKDPKDPPRYDDRHKWHPFQIAFILQCLESLANPDSDYRTIVDLLWFPTGGGKTEAYFGITAFILFLRRLRALQKGESGGGTAVLTRYTLRLLTLDQFYRAALLACSCEKVRRESGEALGETPPVSIGLWVGAEASPNTLEAAAIALSKLKSGVKIPLSGDPTKLKECPWCGTNIGAADYNIENKDRGMRVTCPNTDCYFHKGLPVWIVDEDVYREKPSIIIGTVDKFARLPWIEETGYIFGSDQKNPPPELIIQDELHLISGPLGTLVGLYETAIDLLCKRGNGSAPKIIASTATIRNAQSQIRALFCRDARQFPQPGLDYRDSFFAKEDRSQPPRMFVGVFTPSMSPTTALVRTFGCLLHGVNIQTASDGIRDAYWTLMGYFLSLRELGGARRHIEDDVQDYLKFCAKRDMKPDKSLLLRRVENVEELTSRVGSTELDEIRKRLKCMYPAEDCLDVVLATNMISVGLDVPRLGLMAIAGQPKSTSEYIQASSRIGRRYPGFVINIYKWTHSRDRSHYERFKSYHSRLYSEVEATSVTPYSSRSRERGLHAVLISLIRHLARGMAENSAAVKFQKSDPVVLRIAREIEERVKVIDEAELLATRNHIILILDRWAAMSKNRELSYWSKRSLSLLKPFEEAEDEGAQLEYFPTLNSLRNIDKPAGLYLLRG